MAEVFELSQKPINDGFMLKITPKKDFDKRHFTKRELALMHRLSVEYKGTVADNMIEATHLENLPWDKVFNQEGRKQALIPYELAVRPDEREEVMRVAEERKELLGRLT